MNTLLKLQIVLLAFFLTLGSTFHAHAHKVRVFAYESGGVIITEAKFNSGRPAKNSAVLITKSDGSSLLQGLTDETGIFSFSPPIEAIENQLDLTITVDLGEGHKGIWNMSASDYLGTSLQKQITNTAQSIIPTQAEKEASSHSQEKHECKEIQSLVQQTIAAELAPIKRMLAETKVKKTSLQDILGGLGYIFGLAGIAAYFQFKKTGGKQ